MRTKRISAIIIESGETQDYLVLPVGGSGSRRKIAAPAENAIGKFVIDHLFELQVGDSVTVKWGDVFKIEEDEPEPRSPDKEN